MPAVSLTAPIHFEGTRAALRAPITFSAVVALRAPFNLNDRRAADLRAPFALLQRGMAALRAPFGLLDGNPGRALLRGSWGLLEAAVTVRTTRPYLVRQGQTVELSEASVNLDEGGQFWRMRAQLARSTDYFAMSAGDAVTLNLFGDEYAFVVESLSRDRASKSRGGGTEQRFEITCRSPLWLSLGPNAEPVTRTWDSAATARAVVEELAGETVDWRILDWTIPAGRLAAVEESPISIIARIADTAGAIVESAPDGELVVRYRYPVSIPAVPTATVDHQLAESADILRLSERIESGAGFDRLVLSDRSEGQGYLTAERDPDQSEVILGGEAQRFLAFHSADVEIAQVLISEGTLIDLGEADIEIEDEEVTFSNTDEARASKPVRSGFSYTWYGTGLGAITVGADGMTLRAASSGVAIARVSYTTRARRYSLKAPTTSGGRSEFPIAVYVIGALLDEAGTVGTALRIVVQRGAGAKTGDDIIAPLAGNAAVLLNRGRNEIDAAAAKGVVGLETAYRGDATGSSPVLPGQLIAVEDTQLGAGWRGKVVNVEHRVTGRTGTSTALTIERFLP